MSWQVLALAREQKKKVKVVGGGHSPSDIACTDGFMIHMGKMNRVLQVLGPLVPSPAHSQVEEIQSMSQNPCMKSPTFASVLSFSLFCVLRVTP